jgi:hypothetical protein
VVLSQGPAQPLGGLATSCSPPEQRLGDCARERWARPQFATVDTQQGAGLHTSLFGKAVEAGRRGPQGTLQRGGETWVAGRNAWCWHAQLSGTPRLVR